MIPRNAAIAYPLCHLEQLLRHPVLDTESKSTNVKEFLTRISSIRKAQAEIQHSAAKGEGKRISSRIILGVARVTSRSTLRAGSYLSKNDTQSFFSAECDMAPNRKCGFTLAEVLITLGIIGVVAAMTLPALTKHYEKMVLRNSFKKAYSVLSQNLLKSQEEFGAQPDCHYYTNGCLPHQCVERNDDGTCKRYEMADGSPLAADVCGLAQDCKEFSKIFIKNLKVIKVCDKKAYEKGCIADIHGNDDVFFANNPDASEYDKAAAISGSAGWYKSNLHNNSSAYVLSDGMVIISYSYPFSTRVFAVDVNGKKGPNKWGYDIFAFRTEGEPGKGIRFADSGFVEKGGVSTSTMMSEMGK